MGSTQSSWAVRPRSIRGRHLRNKRWPGSRSLGSLVISVHPLRRVESSPHRRGLATRCHTASRMKIKRDLTSEGKPKSRHWRTHLWGFYVPQRGQPEGGSQGRTNSMQCQATTGCGARTWCRDKTIGPPSTSRNIVAKWNGTQRSSDCSGR